MSEIIIFIMGSLAGIVFIYMLATLYSMSKHTDGRMVLGYNEEEEKEVWLFQLETSPEEIKKKKTVKFKVVDTKQNVSQKNQTL